jgi:flagellar hook-associated protein 1 FlgK
MAGLYSQLYLGSSALGAQRTGVSAAGHNIANVNTPGHTRVDVDLRANAAFIGGVRSLGYTSSADLVLHQRERLADAEMGRANDLAVSSAALEGALALESGSIVDAIAALFGGITELSSNPTDTALRAAAVADVESVGDAFNRAAAAIQESQRTADERLASMARQANVLTEEIAATNRSLRVTNDPTLVDRRNQAARDLATLVGGNAHIDAKGSMRFALEDGSVLVDGDFSAVLEATPDGVNYGGHMRIDVVSGARRRDVTNSLAGARMGAQLHFRDQTSAQMLTDIDQLAFDVATQMNATHQNFAGTNGVSGSNLFTVPTGVAGAATAMSIDAAVLADPAMLATADPVLGPGDNSGLLALAAMRTAASTGSGGTMTFMDEGLRMMTDLGFTVQRAGRDQEIASLRSDSLASLRDTVSGVSVEEELTRLQTFQRASEASARVLQTVDGLLGTLIEAL